ncbi:helix-turn-helix domain-containing protein [Burkholderia ambifaria]|uniref:helix-turn-helix domain-containing protein n=1 Tax=Burkholderia ambifaria TaxID=152480 RepID=UPI003CCA21BD
MFFTSKYGERFKRTAIELYKSGRCGYTRIAWEYDLDAETVQRWVSSYEHMGRLG